MNKRQAKRIALELVLCLIDSEIFNPSELPYTLLEEYGFDENDFAKVRDEVENIGAKIKYKMEKLDNAISQPRKFGSWSFMTEKDEQRVD